MKTSELKGIYETTCQTKGFPPSDGQFKTWKDILGWCERKDLEEAVTRYFTTNLGFPMPAELRALAGQVQRERELQSSAKRYMVMWFCPVCNTTMCGFLTMEDRAMRFCSSTFGPLLALNAPRVNGERPLREQLPVGTLCGAAMDISNDDRRIA